MYYNRKWVILISVFFICSLTLYIQTCYSNVHSEYIHGRIHSLSVKSTNDKDTNPYMIIGSAIDVQVIPYETQVVQGELLEVNVTVFDNGQPISNAKITLTLKQLSKESETTQFIALQPGVYKTTFNTTSLTKGEWNLRAEVETGGDIYFGEASIVIRESTERKTSGSPSFEIISFIGIGIGAMGLLAYAYTELKGRRKRRRKR